MQGTGRGIPARQLSLPSCLFGWSFMFKFFQFYFLNYGRGLWLNRPTNILFAVFCIFFLFFIDNDLSDNSDSHYPGVMEKVVFMIGLREARSVRKRKQ